MKNLTRNITKYLISCSLLFVILGLPSAWEAQPNYSSQPGLNESQVNSGDIDNMQTTRQSNAAKTSHQKGTDQETKRDLSTEESDILDDE